MLCKLCQNEPTREDSHIIPSFVFRWIKSISPTGFLRKSSNPNKRVSDGDKYKLLGSECEDLFSTWEKQFADKIFHPVHKLGQNDLAFDYDQWLSKFCVSLSWRVLTHLTRDGYEYLPYGHGSLVQPTLKVWQDYLCGRREDIASYRQHLLILDKPTSASEEMDLKDLAIYFTRSVDYDTMHSNEEYYVISKICNILIIGSIKEKSYNWKGTSVSLSNGRYEPQEFGVSPCVMNFFDTGLKAFQQGRNDTSDEQLNKIMKAFKRKQGF
ncbi:hypothetical protein [Chamaesiphon sp.]|uniref:hypothetical protein n=1 Tax=Chamaesiphon sp. TaxID=2814140 RepID=UPI0035932A2D